MNEKALELQKRTRRFASDVILFCAGLPQNAATREIIPQLIDSANGTDSNYRAACRARSTKEFIAKIGVAGEEADESQGWLELILESRLAGGERIAALIREANELVSIFVASRKTAERRQSLRADAQNRASRSHKRG
jgi:four helix bundle protein